VADITILFSGKPGFFGGLSNEMEIAQACPKEFKTGNPWSDYAMRLFVAGGNIANWKWKSEDEAEQQHQRACFNGLLGTFGVSTQEKGAIAGWMLSEMLTEVPEYLPPVEKKKKNRKK